MAAIPLALMGPMNLPHGVPGDLELPGDGAHGGPFVETADHFLTKLFRASKNHGRSSGA